MRKILSKVYWFSHRVEEKCRVTFTIGKTYEMVNLKLHLKIFHGNVKGLSCQNS